MHNLVQYEQATKGQRAVNLIIDNILMRLGLTYITGTAVGYLLGSLFPEYTLRIVENTNNLDLFLIGYIVAIFNYLIYYTICEKAFRGYTLGKLLTGTRAIRQDGGELTFKDAFLRSLSRLVPFEAFSGFGDSPWHDSWTKTTVVKSR
ncbi:MAG TPA: RDD family protein [Chitinophagaceae bacterium]|nr:RDD family protein [Chitinophagaceae bacterium]